MEATLIIVLAIILFALIILNNIKGIKPTPLIGGCVGTQYGCCSDNTTPKIDIYGSNCPSNYPIPPPKPIGGCAGTRYGCCPSSNTPKMNQPGTNCPNYPV